MNNVQTSHIGRLLVENGNYVITNNDSSIGTTELRLCKSINLDKFGNALDKQIVVWGWLDPDTQKYFFVTDFIETWGELDVKKAIAHKQLERLSPIKKPKKKLK